MQTSAYLVQLSVAEVRLQQDELDWILQVVPQLLKQLVLQLLQKLVCPSKGPSTSGATWEAAA